MRHAAALAASILLSGATQAGTPGEPGFKFSPDLTAPAGTPVQCAVMATGPNVPVTRIQFTVRVPTPSAGRIAGTLAATGLLPDWTVSQAYSVGMDGEKVLRVVMEAADGASVILSGDSLTIANVSMVPDLWTPAGTDVVLSMPETPPDMNSGVADLSMSDAEGNSLVADTASDGYLDPDLDRPRGDTALLRVTAPDLYSTEDFQFGLSSPFKYYQLLPTVDETGTKLRRTYFDLLGPGMRYIDASGLADVPQRMFLAVILPPFNQEPFLERGFYPAYPGHLLESRWTVYGDAPSPSAALPVEGSLGSSDTNFLSRAIYQETGFPASGGPDDPMIPVGTTSPFFQVRALAEVPSFAADGGEFLFPDGIFPMVAAFAREGMGSVGSSVYFRNQSTRRIHLEDYASGTPFACEGGACGSAAFAAGPTVAALGNPPVEYASTAEGLEIRYTAGSPDSGRWSGYYSSTPSPLLWTLQGGTDSLGRLEVEFRFPDATPETVPNQIVAVFREGSLDYGAVAEYRALRAPVEQFGPNKSLTRVLWFDTQNTSGDYPLTISFGVSGDAAITGPQRVVISRIDFRTYAK